MTVEVCSIDSHGKPPIIPGFDEAGTPPIQTIVNIHNKYSPCECYQMLLESATADIIIYSHDDVEIKDPGWLESTRSVFRLHEDTVAVGLGGAQALGRSNLYKRPYDLVNMARGGYMSNQVDAETHGQRVANANRVVVLDAFFMAIRREWLLHNQWGGWPVKHLTHHCLDLWLACEAARQRKETYMVGIECNHYGGSVSVSPAYTNAKWLQGGTTGEDHALPHRWLFNEYRDVLPLRL